MKEKYKVKSCSQTCWACPSQWDIWTVDGKYIYARYRWGHLSLSLETDDHDMQVIYSCDYGDDYDGCMSTHTLKELTASILDWSDC